MSVKLRLYSFAVAVLLLAALVGWAGRSAWNQLKQLRRDFGAVQSEHFHLAEHVQTSMLILNGIVLRDGLLQGPGEIGAFNQESTKLIEWFRTQKSAGPTPHELGLLNQIEAAFLVFTTNASRFLQDGSQHNSVPYSKALLNTVERNNAEIMGLCDQLKAAERTAINQFVDKSHQAIVGLEQLLEASGALIILLALTLTRLLYRAQIAPLRAQLVESRAIIDRQEKLASLGTLAAGVAHEIRNPLTAINVRVHSLKRTLLAGSSEHEDATIIDQEIQRLKRILNEFLQFARPSDPCFVTVSPDQIFSKVCGFLGPQLEKQSIQLHINTGLAASIRADPDQMEQILINLVQNAADSMEKGGTINLGARTGLVRLGGRMTSVVILEVSDQGKGIPPDVQKRLFDPFFTTKENGAGLGLSIAARIVEKHGGALQYKTHVGRGTTFGIILPRVEKQNNETKTTHSTD